MENDIKNNAFDYDPELVLDGNENFFAFVCPEWDDDRALDEDYDSELTGGFELAGSDVEELLKDSRTLLALWKLACPELRRVHTMVVQPLVNIVEDYMVYEDRVERVAHPELAD